jgi:transposase, IS6 family
MRKMVEESRAWCRNRTAQVWYGRPGWEITGQSDLVDGILPEQIIVLYVRWYLRYCLSYRDLEEVMAERGFRVDHSTIARWVLHYAPLPEELIRPEMRRPNRWRVDQTYIRVAGRWTYLYRAIDSDGNTIDSLLSPNRD